MSNRMIRRLALVLATVLVSWSSWSPAGAADGKAYLVGMVTVDNKDWVSEYRAKNAELLQKYGGRILVRGQPVEVLEGKAPDVDAILLVEFPSLAKARAWHSDPAYEPLKALRQSGTTSHFMLMEQLEN